MTKREQAWLEYRRLIEETGRTPHEADFLAGWTAGQSEAYDILTEVKADMVKMLESTSATFRAVLADLKAVQRV